MSVRVFLWACSRRGLRESGAIARRTREGLRGAVMGAPALCKQHPSATAGLTSLGRAHGVLSVNAPVQIRATPLNSSRQTEMIHMQIQWRDLSGEILGLIHQL